MLVANVFLGVNQGLTWSTTRHHEDRSSVRDGEARTMGLNGCRIARHWPGNARAGDRLGSPHDTASVATVLSWRGVRAGRAGVVGTPGPRNPPSRVARVYARRHGGALGWQRSRGPRGVLAYDCKIQTLSSVSQAGLVNNLNDGMAWGLFPLVFAVAG